jgi:hypothetical protein
MPIQTTWYDDQQTIISYHYEGTWTWEDFIAAADLGLQMAEGASRPVIHLINMKTTMLPKHKDAFTYGRSLTRRIIAQRGTIILVNNVLSASLLNIFKQINPEFNQHFHGVSSIEEAHLLIRKLSAQRITT